METHQIIPGPSGKLETLITTVANPHYKLFAVICHPHPQQQGTMRNKVVTTLMKAYDALGIPTIRFNYRGVGESAGEYDRAIGEVDDALAARAYMQAQYPAFQCAMAGFSFGAYIAAAVASQLDTQHLITLSPAVDRYGFNDLKITCPWLAMIGADDEVASPQALSDFAKSAPMDFSAMPNTGHFFHGQLIPLREHLIQWLKQTVS